VDPSYKQGWYNLGLFYTKKKDYAKAEEAYNKAISLDANFVPAIYNLAGLYCLTRDDTRFDSTVARLAELNPKLSKGLQKDCKRERKKMGKEQNGPGTGSKIKSFFGRS